MTMEKQLKAYRALFSDRYYVYSTCNNSISLNTRDTDKFVCSINPKKKFIYVYEKEYYDEFFDFGTKNNFDAIVRCFDIREI